MYFEEFPKGKTTRTQSREFTVEMLETFLDVSGLYLPMFLTDEAARQLGHEERLIPGPLILSVTMGLVKPTGWFDHVLAVLEFDRLRFLKTMHIGDTVQADIAVNSSKPTRNPDRGLVILSYSAVNQNNETVMTADGKYLMQTRE